LITGADGGVTGGGPPPPPEGPGLAATAVRGLCPRCGAATLFDGWLRFADRCRACGLDLTQFDVGDGPAAFLTLILGAAIVAMAVAVELRFHPPLWVHMALWVPVAAAGVVLSLRVAKAVLLWVEYRAARDGGRLR